MQKSQTHLPTLVDIFEGNGFYMAQFKTPELAIFSYYLESKGQTLIIDPPLDLQPLVDHSKQRKSTIVGIFYTHVHADFIAGNLGLSVPLYMGEGSSTHNIGFQISLLQDCYSYRLGDVSLKRIHTPGHTPESSCFLLCDRDGREEALFSGDTLFLNEVGRPDLATSGELSQEQLAGMLFDSLQKLKVLKPNIRIYPAHGSGSSCGNKIGDGLHCTLEKQLQKNYALKIVSKEEFISTVLQNLNQAPQYYKYDATKNKEELTDYDKQFAQANKALSAKEFLELSKTHFVVDTREHVSQVSQGIIKGAYMFSEGGALAGWVGSIISPKEKILIFSISKGKGEENVRRLLRIGYQVSGYNDFTLEQWKDAGGDVIGPCFAEVEDMNKNPDRIVLDVRNKSEWKETGIVKGALTIPLTQLQINLDKIPKDKEVYVHCKAGGRARAAGSILERNNIKAHILETKIQSILQANKVEEYK